MVEEGCVKIPRFVAPDGSLVVQPVKRGLLMGNRGVLRPKHLSLPQPAAPNTPWITCVIQRDGKPIEATPVKYTKLFFLDEVTALAAGHRPCYSCQRQRYYSFVAAFEKVTGTPYQVMDTTLMGERIDPDGRKKTFVTILDELPSGVMILPPGTSQPHLLLWGRLFPWTLDGYGPSLDLPVQQSVTVLTPFSIVEMLKNGLPLPVNRQETIHWSVVAPVLPKS